MNVVHANTPSNATVLTELEGRGVKITKNTKRRENTQIKQLDAINMRIASKSTIDGLIEKGYLYQGEDGELHVIEQKSTTNVPTKAD